MANADVARIDLGFVAYGAAMAGAVDLHCNLTFDRHALQACLAMLTEVALCHQTYHAANHRITVGGKVRLDELTGDGVMVATPAGSTAYNLSAHGPILPLDAPLLALTPVSPFRPRRWRGALLPNRSV